MKTYTHFGIFLKESKYGLKLTRDNYAIIDKKSTPNNGYTDNTIKLLKERMGEQFFDIYEDDSALYYTDSWCERHLNRALINFDLNIVYYENLNSKEFKEAVQLFIKKKS